MVAKITRTCAALAVTVAFASCAYAQATKPAELKIGITTFTSGAASVFGVPAKVAAELWIEEFNSAGGLNGMKFAPIFIDEGLGGDKLLSEYRRVVQDQGAQIMLASISSGNCNVVAPVAEDLKIVNIMWDCGTEKILEDKRYTYVFRTASNATTEMVAAVLHLLRVKSDFKTIAVVNQDYAWGRDSWELFRNTLLALKPDTKIVAELFPKFGAPDFSTEITRLQALKPDVILSTSWGGDLDTFVRQASQRGLTKTSQFVLPLAESSLERLGKDMPEGVLVGMRGDAYFADPDFKDNAKVKAFIAKFRAKTGAYPIYPVSHVAQGLQAVADAYSSAIKTNKGQWPSAEQVAAALHGLEFRALSRPIRIRADGQALQDQLYGVTKSVPQYPFMIVDQLTLIPADLVTTPVGGKSPQWVKTLKPELLKSDRIKAVGTTGAAK